MLYYDCLTLIVLIVTFIPAQGFKEGINEFSSELGFVVGRAMVGFDIAFEALNKTGNLFEGFFHDRLERPSI